MANSNQDHSSHLHLTHALSVLLGSVTLWIAETLWESKAGGTQTLFSVLLVGAVMALSMVISLLLSRYVFSSTVIPIFSRDLAPITTTLSNLSNHLEKIALGVHESLISIDETEKLEKAARDISVATHDFYWDLDHDFADVVRDNIVKDQKSYHYFCPDNPLSRARIGAFIPLTTHRPGGRKMLI